MKRGRRSPRLARTAGFTLLEVMIAMAILAGALTGLSLALTRAVRASMHARMMTTATYLCRQQMAELEDTFVVDGFADQAGSVEKQVDYKDPAFKDIYSAVYVIDKIKLPSADQIQSAATKLLQDKQKVGGSSSASSSSSSSSSSGANLSSSMSGFMGPVKEMLEQGIRRVTVRVMWNEPGVGQQKVELVAYYTDMRRLPMVR